MGRAIYRIICEKVIDLAGGEEINAVIEAGTPIDEPSGELMVALDFDDDDEDMKAEVEAFRRKVRPEVFEAIKQIAEACDIYIVA